MYPLLSKYISDLKGIGHDWGQFLFTKNIWNEILIQSYIIQTIFEKIEQ